MEQSNQGINADLGNEVEQPDEHADCHDAAGDDGGVLQHLLGSQTTFFSSLRSSRKYFLTLPQVLLNQFSFLTSAMIRASLLGLVVNGVLLAESAILLHFETVGVILLVLHGVVVSLLALGACQDNFVSHSSFLLILPLS